MQGKANVSASANAEVSLKRGTPQTGKATATSAIDMPKLPSDPSLQQLLLENIANGSVATGEDISVLLCSTLYGWQQRGPQQVSHVQAALSELRQLKLLSFRTEAEA